MTAMFVNLPVTDLERAKAFYTAIGFTNNPNFTDKAPAEVVAKIKSRREVAVADIARITARLESLRG